MDKFLEKLRNLSRINMEPNRKAILRGRLVQFMDARPIMAKPVGVPFSSLFARRLMPVGAFALLILIGGGSTFAAESALPGDPLYIVKLKLNEPIIAALKVSEMSKTEWQTQVAVRRLEEADKLAITNKLNDGVKDQIEDNFKRSSAKASEKIAALSEKGDLVAASNISTEFESALKAHSEILAQLGERRGNDSESLKKATIAALDTAAAASDKQDTKVVASNPGIKIAASTKVNLAARAVNEIKEYVAKNNSGLGEEAALAAETRINKASSLLISAQAQLKAEAWSDAFRTANLALRTAQETRVLAQAQLAAGKSTASVGSESDNGVRTMAAAPSLNFLHDSSADAGVGAAAVMAVPAPTSTEGSVELKGSVSSSVDGTSNTLNAGDAERSNP